MLTATAVVVLLALPMAFTLGLLALATRIQRRRDEVIVRQIMVTDAIHREVGAVAAPVVQRRRGRRWRALIPVPFAHADLVGTVAAIAQRVLAEADPASRVEVLLTPQPAAHRSGAWTPLAGDRDRRSALDRAAMRGDDAAVRVLSEAVAAWIDIR